jgi:hypothetical protein
LTLDIPVVHLLLRLYLLVLKLLIASSIRRTASIMYLNCTNL